MSGKKELSARGIIILALCAAILFAQQVALQWLPNIELVSILIIIFTLNFKLRVFYIIYVFVFLQGAYYGFDLWWWVPYLYVWAILALTALLFQKCRSPLIWAVISGTFGLVFGAFCALPHLITGGPAFALAYWVSGIPFSLVHCAGNFVIALTLWKPLMKLFDRLLKNNAVI